MNVHTLTPCSPSRPSRWLKLSLLCAACLICLAAVPCRGETFTRTFEVDFFRDVSSRKLKGLATRSDGRLIAGPVFRDLGGDLPADALWCLVQGETATSWIVGTGPEGRILEITLDSAMGAAQAKEIAKLDDSQVFALARLADQTLLAGSSPKGILALVRAGKVHASVQLPVDSVFDILVLESSAKDGKLAGQALVATGNPGVIYRVDLALFSEAGLGVAKAQPAELASHGITVFGEVRDRNLRRLARLPDARIVAGSSPKGNIYVFPSKGGEPTLLLENKDAEVTDLLVMPDGSLYAAIVASGTPQESRIGRATRPSVQPQPAGAPQSFPVPPGPSPVQTTAPANEQPATPDAFGAPATEKFTGRGTLVFVPAEGLPETVSSRANQAFYRLARHGDLILIAAGEQGDLFGYDPVRRLALTFAGSASAQVNDLLALPAQPGRFLMLRNNPAGLALLDFNDTEQRSAETRRLDLGVATRLGALRFGRLRDLSGEQIQIEARSSLGSDETEGWAPWTTLKPMDAGSFADVGWNSTEVLRGRYARLKLSLPAALSPAAEIDKARWYHTAQNRRPQLNDFRMLSPGFAIIPPAESTPSTSQTLGQVLNPPPGSESGSERKKSPIMGSQVVPSPGTQVFVWNINDADGDALAASFSLKKADANEWLPVVVDTAASFAQMDVSHLEEGLYHTRLTASEQAPRPRSERLSVSFETDDLIIDRSPPQFLDAKAVIEGGRLVLSAQGRDALSLLDGMSVTLNNGIAAETQDPLDQVRDSREERFEIDIPLHQASGATQVEISLHDSMGNRSTRVLRLPGGTDAKSAR